MKDFTTTITLNAPPSKVFAAINDVRGWWSEDVDGPTDALGGEFTYRYGKGTYYMKHRITEMVPNAKVAWRVTDGHISFANPDEWTGTDIVFELHEKGDGTEVTFTHVGLKPDCACFDACKKGWSFYIHQSLRNLVATGKGEPQAAEKS